MESKENEYLEKLLICISNGFQSLLFAAALKLKLFDLLGDEKEPRTSQQIADLGNYKERYVREWLGGMVTGGFVECDSTGTTYWLTSAAKNVLQSEQGQIAISDSNSIPWISLVFEKVVDCFKLDGPRGVPYSDCGPVHEMLAVVTDATWIKYLISHFVPSISGLKEQLERGINCVEFGFGAGTVLLLFAEAFPNSQFYGVDICEPAVATAMKRANEKSLTNVHFVVGDAKQLSADWTSKFEYAWSFDAAHDFARMDLWLKEVMRILVPSGRLSLVEVSASSNVYKNIPDKKCSACYATSLFHCMPVSNYFPESLGLGLMLGAEKAVYMLKESGFSQVEKIDMPWDLGVNMHFLCTKGSV